MAKVILIGTSFLSVFFFPYSATALFSFFASLYFPPTAFLVGTLSDLLYYTAYPTTYPTVMPAFPSASIVGLLLSGVALLVRRFVKARIMGG